MLQCVGKDGDETCVVGRLPGEIGVSCFARQKDRLLRPRAALGLPPVPYDSAQGLDITRAQFDSTQPATWAYAPVERRIFGLGLRAGRLYYAVADGLEIWSVGLNDDGSFGRDPSREIAVPPIAASDNAHSAAAVLRPSRTSAAIVAALLTALRP